MQSAEALIPLDVSGARARIEGVTGLVWGDDGAEFDHVEIDTGLGLDVLVPYHLVPGGLRSELRRTDPLVTLGGQVKCWRAEGVLRLDSGRFACNAEIHVIRQPRGIVLLGLPLLRKFDLLLRELPDDPGRPCMVYGPTI